MGGGGRDNGAYRTQNPGYYVAGTSMELGASRSEKSRCGGGTTLCRFPRVNSTLQQLAMDHSAAGDALAARVSEVEAAQAAFEERRARVVRAGDR